MGGFYFYSLRPCYTGESAYTLVGTIVGTGSIAGQTFSAAMTRADGTPAPGAPAAAVTDAANRVVTVTLPGQAAAGDYTFVVRRTDDGSGLVVLSGTAEVTDPLAANAWGG